MKPLRIRQWMFVGLLTILIIPRLFYEISSLLVPDKGGILPFVIAVLAGICAFLFIGFQMGRFVVRPLEAMGKAARRIAGGNLNFELPKSSAAEVEDVRAAFQSMSKGLRDSIARQSKLEEERRIFIGAIAHDIRTPLFVLRGSLQRLEKGLTSDPEKIARYVTICGQKAEQLDRLVAELFSYTKMDSIEQTLQNNPVEMNTLIDEVLDDFLALACENNVEIVYDSPNTTCIVRGDGHLLRRVFGNLLDNAIRYTPPEGKVEMKWHMENGQFIFCVKDTGSGIPEQDVPHLFEPFYRAEESRNRETGGTGLGLTIARRILMAHGGDLVAENRSSAGAVFTGWLPLHNTKY